MFYLLCNCGELLRKTWILQQVRHHDVIDILMQGSVLSEASMTKCMWVHNDQSAGETQGGGQEGEGLGKHAGG